MERWALCAWLCAVGLVLSPLPVISGELVKQSSSGICHPPASSYYERTKSYKGFESIEGCLSEGGRLPNGLSLAALGGSGYERSRFGHGWADDDGNCRNSRMEALIALSTIPVRFASGRECRVIAGRWISPFTGKVIHDASTLDADHVVPLKWAWDHGADQWSQERRERFANDLVNVWPVEASLNRQKGARGLDEWLPPTGRCQYVSRFIRVAKLYELGLQGAELATYKQVLQDSCHQSNALGD